MTINFTKIICFGEDCILVTISEKAQEPVLILTKNDIEKLNKEWVEPW